MENDNLNSQNPAGPESPAPQPPSSPAAQQPSSPAAQPDLPAGQTRLWLKIIAVLYAISIAASFVVITKMDSARKAAPKSMDLGKLRGLAGLASSKKDAVAVIPIFGVIYQTDSSKIWERGSQSVVKKIKAAAAKKEVKAIVLDINSPGGSVGAVQEIYSAVVKAKASSKKPFVARFGDVSASGGYYVAAACDSIVAQPGTITGSIGVVFSVSSFAGLMNKVGMRNETIKSGKFKDIGSPMRNMTPEERKLLQGLIDDTYDQFVNAVAAGRKMPLEVVKFLSDGRIYTGRQALEAKLVDKLGDLQDALDLAGEMGKIGKNPRVIRDIDPLEQFLSIIDSKLGFFGGSAVEKAFNMSPRLEYRWYGI
ncbi:MAG: signal peptide peptidase SppA [Elusimicrobia bacterium]|nr:signal peptide peptidase SppA [Elusimicrobiota bacterium]